MVDGILTVLVVDHDDDARAQMLAFIGERGFEVIGARNAHEGLDHLRRGAVDLIVTDYGLDPHWETGCWMLLRAQGEGLLSGASLILISTGNPEVRPPSSLPHAHLTSRPYDLPEVERYLNGAREARSASA